MWIWWRLRANLWLFALVFSYLCKFDSQNCRAQNKDGFLFLKLEFRRLQWSLVVDRIQKTKKKLDLTAFNLILHYQEYLQLSLTSLSNKRILFEFVFWLFIFGQDLKFVVFSKNCFELHSKDFWIHETRLQEGSCWA